MEKDGLGTGKIKKNWQWQTFPIMLCYIYNIWCYILCMYLSFRRARVQIHRQHAWQRSGGSRDAAAAASASLWQLRQERVPDLLCGQHPHPHHAVHEPRWLRDGAGRSVLIVYEGFFTLIMLRWILMAARWPRKVGNSADYLWGFFHSHHTYGESWWQQHGWICRLLCSHRWTLMATR